MDKHEAGCTAFFICFFIAAAWAFGSAWHFRGPK